MRPCVLLVVLPLVLMGCGSAPDDRPELGLVKGTVKLNGEPVEGARISFRPVDGGLTSQAVTNADGSYELVYLRESKGAKVGEHFVQITTYEDPIVEDDGSRSGGKPELMPEAYARGDLERRTVSAGENVIDFDLP